MSKNKDIWKRIKNFFATKQTIKMFVTDVGIYFGPEKSFSRSVYIEYDEIDRKKILPLIRFEEKYNRIIERMKYHD